ncbi:flagellar biosynthetic protein FliO [Humidesulfovibrio mexicanus]|uniref:Flagellar protein n=1 Tax=Humidesulfovibrio mexicanus TaxID=147047 RepID=A0A238ZTS2_9BACT|nr:flagellar biosynthetic protein FliO [Humidesulfovibrio mexicanus]SNR86619.1 flagellar biosynthetic protein FliO [Humidesulfovibrio mexicanus]
MPDQLFFDIVKMVVALACIVGLIYGVVYVLKRLLPGAGAAGGERLGIQVLTQLNVGSRQRIAVIRVQDRTLVVGVTEGSINTLAELTPPDAAAKKEADDPKIFSELLSWPKDGAGRGAQQPGAASAPVRAGESDADALRFDGIFDEHPRTATAGRDQRKRDSAGEPDQDDGPPLFPPGKRPLR